MPAGMSLRVTVQQQKGQAAAAFDEVDNGFFGLYLLTNKPVEHISLYGLWVSISCVAALFCIRRLAISIPSACSPLAGRIITSKSTIFPSELSSSRSMPRRLSRPPALEFERQMITRHQLADVPKF